MTTPQTIDDTTTDGRTQIATQDVARETLRIRTSLVNHMRRLAQDLVEEAARLESEPDRCPDSLGYLAARSVTRDIDSESISLNLLMRVQLTLRFISTGSAE